MRAIAIHWICLNASLLQRKLSGAMVSVVATITCCLLFILVSTHSAWSQNRIEREFQLKAAFLPKFLDFIDIDVLSIATERLEREICIIGENPFGTLLQEVIEYQPSSVQSSIRHVSLADSLSSCSLLYISRSEELHLQEILERTSSQPILTVSDIEHFAERGGMIQFIVESPFVRFIINQEAARRNHLKFTSQLLALATRVIGGQVP